MALKSDLLDYDLDVSQIVSLLKKKKAKISAGFYKNAEAKVIQDSITVSGLTTIQEIKQVQNSLASAIDEGKSFSEWQDSISEDILDEMLAAPETIFRTNIQNSYNEAAFQQAQEVSDAFPFLMYSAVNDFRTRPEHLDFDGFIAAVDDPIWEQIGPPNPLPDGSGIFNCRCTRIQLDADQALERGGPSVAPDLQAQDKKQSLDSYYKDQVKDGLSDSTKEKALEFLDQLKNL